MSSQKKSAYSVTKNGQRYSWDVQRLWDLSSQFEVFDFEISEFSGFDMDVWFCGVNVPTVRNVYDHCLRISAANLDYPIMLDPKGCVLDGVHRLLKAKTLGQNSVLAVRFASMPKPDHIERINND